MDRPLCKIGGCKNVAKYRGLSPNKKKKYYRRLCSNHYRYRHGYRPRIYKGNQADRLRKKLSGVPCQNCGWGLAECDLHRIIPGISGGKYLEDNVRVLCPNCHRLAHKCEKSM